MFPSDDVFVFEECAGAAGLLLKLHSAMANFNYTL